MNRRDKAILGDLERFRVMSRNDIVDLHFSGLKNAVKCANAVLKRLRRDEHIEVNTNQQPYLYFPCPAPIKRDSQKIPHFLSIVDTYKQLCKYEKPKLFTVEPKYGKGYMEPDIFCIWRDAPFFIEVQRSIYSEKVMADKFKRYELYYHSREWMKEAWQPQQEKIFPAIIILTDTRYTITSDNSRVYQVRNIADLIALVETPRLAIEKKSVKQEKPNHSHRLVAQPMVKIQAGSSFFQK